MLKEDFYKIFLVDTLLFLNKVKNNVPKYNTFIGCVELLSLGRAGRSCYGTPKSMSSPYPLNLQNKIVQGIRELSITYVVLIEPNKSCYIRNI